MNTAWGFHLVGANAFLKANLKTDCSEYSMGVIFGERKRISKENLKRDCSEYRMFFLFDTRKRILKTNLKTGLSEYIMGCYIWWAQMYL